MLGPRFRNQLFKTCLRQKPTWATATKAPRFVRRYVSTHDLDGRNHAENPDKVTCVIDANTEDAGTAQTSDKARPFTVRVREADGRWKDRAVKRSYPNGKAKDFSRELTLLITYPKLPGSDETAAEGKDTSCEIAGTSRPKNATRRENVVPANLVSDIQSSRWRLSATGQFILRTICVVKEQYPRLLRAIEKEADVLKHHPHILGYELNGSYIVNMICTTHKPAGLSRKDTTLAIHINYLIDQLDNAVPSTDHAATQSIIDRLCNRNMALAVQSTKQPQTDSISTPIDSQESNLSSNEKSPGEVGLPEQQDSPRSPIFSVESTIISSILGKRRCHSAKSLRMVPTDTITLILRRMKKLKKSARVPRLKARSAEKSMLIHKLSSRSAKTVPFRKPSPKTTDTVPIGKLPLKSTKTLPVHKTSSEPAAPPLIRKHIARWPIPPTKPPITQDPTLSKTTNSPNHNSPTTMKKLRTRSEPNVNQKKPKRFTPPLLPKATSNKTATPYHKPKYNEATNAKLDPRRELKIIRTTLNPSNMVRTTLVTSKEVHITRKYTGNEPLTAGDVLRGTRPGSVHEKDLALFWGHLF